MTTLETTSKLYYHAELHIDEDPLSPREGYNLATIACDHGRHNLGDTTMERLTGFSSQDFKSAANLRRYIELKYDTLAFAWLGLLDHSGLHLYMGGGTHWSDGGGWDSGTVGFAFVSEEKAVEAWGTPDVERAERALEVEVETYDAYLQGEVYGYTIDLENGETVDSCWEYYGYNNALTAMEEALDELAAAVPEQLVFNFEKGQ